MMEYKSKGQQMIKPGDNEDGVFCTLIIHN